MKYTLYTLRSAAAVEPGTGPGGARVGAARRRAPAALDGRRGPSSRIAPAGFTQPNLLSFNQNRFRGFHEHLFACYFTSMRNEAGVPRPRAIAIDAAAAAATPRQQAGAALSGGGVGWVRRGGGGWGGGRSGFAGSAVRSRAWRGRCGGGRRGGGACAHAHAHAGAGARARAPARARAARAFSVRRAAVLALAAAGVAAVARAEVGAPRGATDVLESLRSTGDGWGAASETTAWRRRRQGVRTQGRRRGALAPRGDRAPVEVREEPHAADHVSEQPAKDFDLSTVAGRRERREAALAERSGADDRRAEQVEVMGRLQSAKDAFDKEADERDEGAPTAGGTHRRERRPRPAADAAAARG